MTGKAPTIKDVAELANVHHSTASRALHNNPEIHVETALRVRAAAAQLGYVPNVHAQALKKRESQPLVAVITDSPSIDQLSRFAQPFWLAMLMGMTRYLAQSGIGVIQLTSEVADILSEVRTQATFMMSITGEPLELPESVYDKPLIVESNHYLARQATATIGHDHSRIAREASQYLREHGSQRVAYLPLSDRDVLSVAAAQGYSQWCSEVGQEPFIIAPHEESKVTQSSIEAAIRSGVDGIYATTGELVALADGIVATGKSCPDDVQVICIGEGVVEQIMRPQLSSVNLFGARCARDISELITKIIRKEPFEKVIFEYELMARGSTRA